MLVKSIGERTAERDRRVALLNELMSENDLEAIVCHSTGAMAYQAEVKFMTDLYANINRMFSYMKKGEMPYAFTGRADTHFHSCLKSFLPKDHVLCCEDIIGEIIKLINDLPGERPRVGIPSLSDIPLLMWNRIKDTKAEFVDITDAFVEKKAPKSEYELSVIRYACDIAIESFEEVVKFIKPGKTELEVIGTAEGYLRSKGALQLLLLTRSAMPHPYINMPTAKEIGPDDIFIYSCEIAGPYGYWTQIIRPIFMSKNSYKDSYDVLQVTKEAIEAGRDKFRPGNTIGDVAAAIEDVVAKRGCRTGIWSGHGMGIDLGDGISIARNCKLEVKPNMILTMHPSVINDTDGVLYADTFMSTEGAAVNLTEKYTGTPFYEDLIQIIK